MPHHSAPRLGSVCPHSGFGAWAAAMGHPWPSAAKPASCRFTHAPKPAFGQRGLTGRLRSRSKARARRPSSRPEWCEAEADQQQIKYGNRFLCKHWLFCRNWVSVGAGLPAMASPRSTWKNTFQMWERACSRRWWISRHMYQLTHRIREQARSHSLIQFFQVVRGACIAGKPAPTVDRIGF